MASSAASALASGDGERTGDDVREPVGRVLDDVGPGHQHGVIGDGPEPRSSVHAVARGPADHAVADLVDDPGDVGAEARGEGDAEPRRCLRQRRQLPVGRVEAGGRHPDAELPRGRVRFGHLQHLQHLGTAELLEHHCSGHRSANR
jgi:hypothetical protein